MQIQNSKLNYFLYARRSVEKSDKEENVVSIDSQLAEMKTFAEKHGLNIVGTFSETRSAKIPYKRTEFPKMIQQIESGKANGILCWKMDRLCRNAIDEGTIKYLLQSGTVQNIQSLDKSFYPDDNVLLASVEFGTATQFSRDLSKHVKRGLRAWLASGVRPSNAPIGYKNSHYREKGTEEILVDEERFPLVRKLFDLMLSGQNNPWQLIKVAEDIGLTLPPKRKTYKNKTLSKSGIYRILTNSFYYGDFEFPIGSGEWYHGKHTPMITKEEFDRVQFLLGRKGKAKPKTHSFAYTGLMRCGECGCTITAEEKWKHQKNGNVHHYIFYHCTHKNVRGTKCSQKNLEEKNLDIEILKYLKELEIPKLFHEWAIKTLLELHEREKNDRNSILHSKQKLYDDVVIKLDRLLEMRMASEITPDEYSKKKSEIEQEKLTLKNQLDRTDERIDTWIKKVEDSLSFAEQARIEFESAIANKDWQKKKKIFTFLGYNHSIKDKILDIQTEKPILLIKQVAFEANSIIERLEPPETLEKQGEIKQKYTDSTRLCGTGESNSSPQFGKLLFYR